MAIRKLPLLWAIAACIAFLPAGACRPASVCVRTIKAICACDDPFYPDQKTCTAVADVECEQDGPNPDPCKIQPCCRIVTDGSTDLATP